MFWLSIKIVSLVVIYSNMTVLICMHVCRWVWAEAGAQPHVEEALSVGGFGYPVSGFACFLSSHTLLCTCDVPRCSRYHRLVGRMYCHEMARGLTSVSATWARNSHK